MFVRNDLATLNLMAVREPVIERQTSFKIVTGAEAPIPSVDKISRTPFERALIKTMKPVARAHNWLDEPENRIMAGYLAINVGLVLINRSNPAAGLVFEIGFAAYNSYMEKSARRETLDS